MHPAWGHIIGGITVVLMVTFVAIWIWAWRRRHRAVFQRMADLPMEDAVDPLQGNAYGERT
jgi:cytochrome c oxidase cbb3-type subunit 4